jgi:N-acyl-D-amino-acid deacylase
MGEASRAPTADELEKMRGLVARAMQDGALGLSTGLEYTPGLFAEAKEIQTLAAVAHQYHGIYTTHMRDEGNNVVASLSEAIEVARAVGIPVEVSHLKWRGRVNWGKARGLVDMIRHAQSEGLRVKCDAYPYTASSTTLDVLLPKAAREGGASRLRARLQNPDEHQLIIAAILEQMRGEGWENFSYARVAYCDFAPEYNGLTIPEITALFKQANAVTIRPASATEPRPLNTNGGNVTDVQSQAETICRLAARGAVQMIYEAMSEEDVASILQFSDCMLGSDSNIRNGEGRPHPRGYGAAPRWFSLFVGQQKLMRLEEAVRRMTALPAETFGLSLRGQLRPGYFADIVIFDPATLKDEATYDSPFRAPDGIEYVLVNGRIALERGQTSATDAGQVIKHKD